MCPVLPPVLRLPGPLLLRLGCSFWAPEWRSLGLGGYRRHLSQDSGCCGHGPEWEPQGQEPVATAVPPPRLAVCLTPLSVLSWCPCPLRIVPRTRASLSWRDCLPGEQAVLLQTASGVLCLDRAGTAAATLPAVRAFGLAPPVSLKGGSGDPWEEWRVAVQGGCRLSGRAPKLQRLFPTGVEGPPLSTVGVSQGGRGRGLEPCGNDWWQ